MGSPLPGMEAHRRALPVARADSRLRLKPTEDARLGGVMILFFPGAGGEAYFPLIQRPEYPGAHGGQISLPGGKYEEGDDTITDTALRETHEEIGVSPEGIQVIGHLSEIYIHASNFRVTPVVGVLQEKPEFRREPLEVDEILEIQLSQLMDTSFHKAKDIRVRGMHLPDTPYYDLQERVVWGATAMILSELYHILEARFNGS